MNHAELIARLRGPWGSLAEGINIAEEAADVLSRLNAGDVRLPEPDVKDWTESASGMTHRRYSHTRAQLQDYGDRRAAAAVLVEREKPEPVAIVRKCRNDEGPILNSNNDEISVNLPPGTLLYIAPGAGNVPMTDDERGFACIEHLGPHSLTGGKMSIIEAFARGIDAAEAHHGVKP